MHRLSPTMRAARSVAALLAALALLALACDRARAPETPPSAPAPVGGGSYAPDDYAEEITSGGQARQYRLHVPPGYTPDRPLPLVLNLHGFSATAAQQEALSQMDLRADAAGFMVVYPQGLGSPPSWLVAPGPAGSRDVDFVRDLIDTLESRLSIDPARVYATGISNGGGMVNRLGCNLSETIAAIAPVSGAYLTWEDCQPSRPVPLVAFHGTADHVVPYEGQGRALPPVRDWAAAWAARNGCDATPAVTFQQGEVTGETWGSCRANATVTLYTIDGRGHSWPGGELAPGLDLATQDIHATDAIWDFFAAHPMP